MTVLGSVEICWKKQACPASISLKSNGGGLKKHVVNSIVEGKKRGILYLAKAASLRVCEKKVPENRGTQLESSPEPSRLSRRMVYLG